MVGTIYKYTYPSGITLNNPISTIATTAVVSTPSPPSPVTAAVYGSSSANWVLYNQGMVTANPEGVADGIGLAAGGTIVNGSPTNTAALISGALGSGVSIGPGASGPDEAGTVTNYGTISSEFAAVRLAWGGTVSNSGLITSTRSGLDAIDMAYGAGSVRNSGYIAGARDAINLGAGGQVTNQDGGTISGVSNAIYTFGIYSRVTNQAGGLITSDGRGIAVFHSYGTVVNYGSIVSDGTARTGYGVLFVATAGGAVVNGAGALIASHGVGVAVGDARSLTNFGTITGYLGVLAGSFPDDDYTIVNYGTITGTGGTAISLGGGGEVTGSITVVDERGSTLNGAIAGFIKGDVIDFADETATAVSFSNGVLDLLNGSAVVGSVQVSGTFGSDVFTLKSDGARGTDVGLSSMAGTIYAGAYLNGIVLDNPDTQNPTTIATGAYVTSTASGGGIAAYGSSVDWTVVNYGTVTDTNGAFSAIDFHAVNDAYVVNKVGGLISGGEGISSDGTVTVTNYGTIGNAETCTTGVAIGNGIVANAAGGVILGLDEGIDFLGPGTGTVTNYGTIEGTGSVAWGVGLPTLTGPAVIMNGTHGVISGVGSGISAEQGTTPGSLGVTNYGTIEGVGTIGVGIGAAVDSATIINGSNGLISGVLTGIRMNAGTVANDGTVSGNYGVEISYAGVVTNASGGVISGAGSGPAAISIGLLGGPGTLSNYGTIRSTGGQLSGVELGDGGTIINAGSGLITAVARISAVSVLGTAAVTNSGIIEDTGAYSNLGSDGVYIAQGVVANYGSVLSTGPSSSAVAVRSGGTVKNSGGITGYDTGVLVEGGSGAITNHGAIQATGTAADGVALDDGGSVANYGSIGATGSGGIGILLGAGGTVTNGSTADTAATVSGARTAISIKTITGGVTNFGTVISTASGTAGGGVYFSGGGTFTNEAGAVVNAARNAFSSKYDAVTINNYGVIENTGTPGSGGLGIYFGGGGSIVNKASGTISSVFSDAITVKIDPATLTNYGLVKNTPTGAAGVYFGAGGAIINGSTANRTATLEALNNVAVVFRGTIGTNVTNFGTIIGTGTNSSGIYDNGGSTITNEAGGQIGGYGNAINTKVAAETILNYGTLTATSTIHTDVYFGAGGSLVNGSTNDTSALVNAANSGVTFKNDAGTVTNFATIAAPTGMGVYMGAGGTIINGSTADRTAAVTANNNEALVLKGTVASNVYNFGTLSGSGTNSLGIYTSAGGTITNEVGGRISSYSDAVVAKLAAESVVNYGTISNTATTKSAIFFNAGGSLTNGSASNTSASITGSNVAVNFGTVAGTVRNFGTITGSGPNGSGVYLGAGGTLINGSTADGTATVNALDNGAVVLEGTVGANVVNFGTLSGNGFNSSGILDTGGGTITNEVGGQIGAYGNAIHSSPGAGAENVLNYGVLTATSTVHTALYFGGGGSLTNGSTSATYAVIIAGNAGVTFKNAAGTVTNFGNISAPGTSAEAIYLGASGVVTNVAGALISAEADAVFVTGLATGPAASVSNAGTIQSLGATGNLFAVDIDIGGTVTNSGLISGAVGVGSGETGAVTIINGGTITGTGGTAVAMSGPGDTLVVDPKSVLNGAISGFVSGDMIDFAQESGTAVSFSYGVLSLMQGGGVVASVDLSGTYTAGEFAVGPDGQGGTDVTLSSTVSEAQLTSTSDFNGDGMSDVLWQNDNAQDSGSGQTAIWLMDGVNPSAEDIITTVPTSWHVIGTGDFYGTGDAAILWQNDDGQAGIWEMNGTNPTAETVFASPPPSWHMIATGDFNGDGYSDVLWQYEDTGNSSDSQNGNVAIWEMNGASAIAAAVVAQPGPDWNVIGTGDFNGDGKSDILWQYEDSQNASDPQNGNVAIWEMNGLTPITEAVIAQPGPDWHVVGTGDFNGDGKADILWQYEDGQNASDPQNGNVAIWEMNGLTPIASAVVAQPGSAWHAIGTGDYDGSGRSDILWQNTDGQAAIWLMNGLTPTTESVFAAPPSSWHVIPA